MAKSRQGVVALAIASFFLVGMLSRCSPSPLPANAILEDPPEGLAEVVESAVRNRLKKPNAVQFPPGRIVRITEGGFRVTGIAVEQESDDLETTYEYRVVLIRTAGGFEPAAVSLIRGATRSSTETPPPMGGLSEDE